MNKNGTKTAYQEDALRAYFEQIKKTPLLTFEEELELSRKIEAGDQEARRKLIESNLRLVVKIAKGFATSDVAFLDLVQEGNLGLLKAASKYDYRKNVRFSTYASWWIKQTITRALSNKRRSIRLPHRKEDSLRKIQQSFNVLSQKLMRRPSVEEVCLDVKMVKADVVEILSLSTVPVSLDSDITQTPARFTMCTKITLIRRTASSCENHFRTKLGGFLIACLTGSVKFFCTGLPSTEAKSILSRESATRWESPRKQFAK